LLPKTVRLVGHSPGVFSWENVVYCNDSTCSN